MSIPNKKCREKILSLHFLFIGNFYLTDEDMTYAHPQ